MDEDKFNTSLRGFLKKVGITSQREIEKAGDNFSAYVPDLPGCVATGESVKAVETEIRDAIRFHIEGLKEDGLPVPKPTSIADYVET